MTTMEMWLTGISITVLVALLIFLANQYITRRNSRIERVVSAYVSQIKSGNFTNGLDVLLKSGALELASRFEMSDVCCKICKRTTLGQHPNYMKKLLPNRKILPFLKFCRKNHHDISSSINTAGYLAEFTQKF